ncbi:MAG: glycosyltransferase family 4 protein [Acidimicrobiales bacterium]
MTRRPTRIDQVIPSIVERDAVSHHTIEAQQVLRSLGYVSEIYSVNMGPEMAGRVHPLSELPRLADGRQWICYQGSIGSPAADAFAAHPAPKLLNYHNITPSELVERWMPFLGDKVRLGREQLAALAPDVVVGICDSAYNARELDSWGYKRTIVSMLMVDHTNFDVPPDRRRRADLAAAKERGGVDWLFVGQMIPHKAHHDVILAFAAYLEAYDPKARLHLAGRPSCPAYALALTKLVDDLGIAASVDIAGSVTSAELAALYEAADVYVCCSDHEGFCAPLLEAMHHGLPIVAYEAAAVPETVADAGIVLGSKRPSVVAAGVRRVIEDALVRAQFVERGRGRAASFTLDRARRDFAQAVESAVSSAI